MKASHLIGPALYIVLSVVCLSYAMDAQGNASQAENAATTAPAMLPDDKGKTEVVSTCNKCHGLSVITQTRQTRADWAQTVDHMVGMGAEATDDQVDLIVGYLAAHFGKPIYINKASADELERSLGLTSDEAAALLKYRQEHGDFKSVDDLRNVPDVDGRKIQEQSANIVYEQKAQ